jgi:hypothetical protein
MVRLRGPWCKPTLRFRTLETPTSKAHSAHLSSASLQDIKARSKLTPQPPTPIHPFINEGPSLACSFRAFAAGPVKPHPYYYSVEGHSHMCEGRGVTHAFWLPLLIM